MDFKAPECRVYTCKIIYNKIKFDSGFMIWNVAEFIEFLLEESELEPEDE